MFWRRLLKRMNPSVRVIVVIVVIVALALLLLVPEIQGRYLADNVAPEDIPALVDEYRRTMAQILAGVALLGGLYLTWRRIGAAERTVEVTQDGQITERFTRAIEQLGNEKIEVRLGGIYALERIARDSEKDHWPIIEVLTTYVRDNSPATQPVRGPQPERTPTSDVQAILVVLGRRTRSYNNGEPHPLDLHKSHLRDSRLISASLQHADLSYSNLIGADLRGANLEGANFSGANLENAILKDANLIGANLRGASLGYADLKGANLEDATLARADLQGAYLIEANVKGTNFYQADLRHASIGKLQHWREIKNLRLANVADLLLYRAGPVAFKAWAVEDMGAVDFESDEDWKEYIEAREFDDIPF